MIEQKTPLQRAVSNWEKRNRAQFKPSPATYKAVGINQKRFGLIRSGKLEATSGEIRRLADYFGVKPSVLIPEPQQLALA